MGASFSERSGAFWPGGTALVSTSEGTILDPDQGVGVDVTSGDPTHFIGCDPGQSSREPGGVRERQVIVGEVDQAIRALTDGLIVEDPGASQVVDGLRDFLVAEVAAMQGVNLIHHRRSRLLRLIRTGADINTEHARGAIGGVGHSSRDAVGQAQLIPKGGAQPVGEARTSAEDVVEHRKGFEVGVPTLDAKVPDHQMDLFPGVVHAS